MPLPSLKFGQGKSEREKTTEAETSYPAGEATPVEITDSTPIPTLPVHMYLNNKQHGQKRASPRPGSSWYSQPGISHNPSQYHNHCGHPASPPPVPRLTSAALRSLEERFAASDSQSETENSQYCVGNDLWQHNVAGESDDGNVLSSTSTPARSATPVRRVSVDAYLSATKRTPVSEYLRDRTWIPASPVVLGSPPIDENSISRRQSIRRSVSSLVVRTVRKDSTSSSGGSLDRGGDRWTASVDRRKIVLTARPDRPRSSATALPSLYKAEPQAVNLADSRRSQANQFTQIERYAGLVNRNPPNAVGLGINFGVPYEKTKMGLTPISVTTIWEAEGRQNRMSAQKPRPKVITRQQMTPTASQYSMTPSSATTSLHRSRANHLIRAYTRPSSYSRPLQTQTRDPIECSDQGAHLFIGSMRGPTPAGLRSLHNTMDRAIAKHGEVEGASNGCKEVRKWLRHEERGVIEWVLAYVRGRWGVEV